MIENIGFRDLNIVKSVNWNFNFVIQMYVIIEDCVRKWTNQ